MRQPKQSLTEVTIYLMRLISKQGGINWEKIPSEYQQDIEGWAIEPQHPIDYPATTFFAELIHHLPQPIAAHYYLAQPSRVVNLLEQANHLSTDLVIDYTARLRHSLCEGTAQRHYSSYLLAIDHVENRLEEVSAGYKRENSAQNQEAQTKLQASKQELLKVAQEVATLRLRWATKNAKITNH